MQDNNNFGFFDYAEKIKLAKIDQMPKALLWFYAYVFNWTEKNPSFYTQSQICAYVGCTPSRYQRARKYLEKLNWIQTHKESFDAPVFVTPKIGHDDPAYDQKSWAKGHRSNKLSLLEIIESLPENFRDPFHDNGTSNSGF